MLYIQNKRQSRHNPVTIGEKESVMDRKRTVVSMLLLLALLVTSLGGVAAQEETPEPAPPERAYLGVTVMSSGDDPVEIRVVSDSPAEEAGLLDGDIISAVDGETVTAESIAEVIGAYAPGDTVTLEVTRDDETLEIEVTLGIRPEEPDRFEVRPRAEMRDEIEPLIVRVRPLLGVQLTEDEAGVFIEEVMEGSPAEEADLQAGDRLVSINEEEITSIEQAVELVGSMQPGDAITVIVERDDEELEFEITLASAPLTMRQIMIGGDQIAYLPDEAAWEVQELRDGSPLAEAGLQPGDRITAVNDESYSPDDILGLLAVAAQAETLTLTVERDDETLEIEVPAAAVMALMTGARFGPGMPESRIIPRAQPGMPFEFGPQTNRARLGVRYLPLDEQTAIQRELDVTEGAVILEVEAESPAEIAGLLVDDVVVSVDGDAVDARRNLAYRLQPYEPGESVTLEVLRAGETLEIEVTLGHFPQSAGMLPFREGSPGRLGPALRFFGPDELEDLLESLGPFRFSIPRPDRAPSPALPESGRL
jgi:S1-C subfamily serine protease